MRSATSEGQRRLARVTAERYPDETARLVEGLSRREGARLLESLSETVAAAVLQRLAPATAASVLESMSEERTGTLLTRLDPPVAASILATQEDGPREGFLGLLDSHVAQELRDLLTYPIDTAGSVMDPRVLALHPDATVAQALKRLRSFQNRRVRRVFVIDGERRPTGSIRIQDLAMARPSAALGSIAEPGPVVVPDTAGREEVVETLMRSRLPSLPVVDFEGRLVGVIRDDVLLAAATEEATADMQSMVGASRDERALSPVSFAVRKRLPWLEVNLGTAFLAAAVVGLFESTIASFTALAVLLPVVAGQSGNTGAQALAVTMRGLALREIRVRQWFRVALKETRVAFINGIAVAVTTALAVYFWSGSVGLTLVIGVSMVMSMVAAGLAGAGIPLFLTAIRQDPAQSSSIILTTVTDVTGFFSFLGIATLLSEML